MKHEELDRIYIKQKAFFVITKLRKIQILVSIKILNIYASVFNFFKKTIKIFFHKSNTPILNFKLKKYERKTKIDKILTFFLFRKENY